VIPHYLSPHQETEWNVPFAQCVQVLRELKAWVADTQFPANHLIEVRFVKRGTAQRIALPHGAAQRDSHATRLCAHPSVCGVRLAVAEPEL
jgi:hypothetical protein